MGLPGVHAVIAIAPVFVCVCVSVNAVLVTTLQISLFWSAPSKWC